MSYSNPDQPMMPKEFPCLNSVSWLLAAISVAARRSLLLYKAWLAGKPVLSLQLGQLNPASEMLKKRPGICILTDPADWQAPLAAWLATLPPRGQSRLRPEWAEHRAAPQRVAELVMRLGASRR